MKLYRKHWVIILITPILVAIDQWSKLKIHSFYKSTEIVLLPGYLKIKYAENKGLAFGLFADQLGSWSTWIFLGISIIALAIIVNLFFRTEQKATLLPTALSFVLAGALGNLIDRFHWGYVVDFLLILIQYHGEYWPTFNVADILIVVGIILLIADSVRPEPKPEAMIKSIGQETKGGASE